MQKTTITGSTTINEVGYDPQTNDFLVQYYRTGEYIYPNFPKEEYDAIMEIYAAGGSIGSEIHKRVKGREFRNIGKELRAL